ncbi:restriction endonuclease subunit S [Polaribacter marinivivus]|uniref:restriction endonuclease subunit S n=1 Tax=Polaribacter marinivivus TaxID=1524260 RepID=UPI003D343345
MAVPRIRFKDDNGQYFPDWSTGRIKDFGYFYYGKSAPKWSVTEDARTPCVRYGELYSKFNGIVDKIHSYTNIEKSNLKFSKGNEVLVPRVGENPLDFARCSYLPFKDVAIGEMISVYNTHQNPLFISILFNATCKNKFARLVEGGNVSNLYFRYLEEVEINIPKKEEQQKIATFLTAVDKRISLLQKKVDLLEDYKKGVMQQLFSQQLRFKDDNGQDFPDWEEKKLGELFKISAGGDIKKENVSKIKNEIFKYPIYANSEKNKGLYGYSNFFKIDYECITVTGRGSLGVANARKEKFYPIVRLLVLKPKDNCDVIFYENLINQLNFFHESTGVPQLTSPQISTYKVKVPSYKEQQKIASFLENIDKKTATINQQVEGMQSFKKGLLQQMFV